MNLDSIIENKICIKFCWKLSGKNPLTSQDPKIYHNSLTSLYQGNTDGVNPNRVLSNNIFVVGSNGYSTKGEFFNGYISEIIIFDRALKNSEIQPIVEYLSRKYSIKLS